MAEYLQKFLNIGQGGTLKTDGIFGPKTYSALKAYQYMHGLKSDGIYGPHTYGFVKNVMEG